MPNIPTKANAQPQQATARPTDAHRHRLHEGTPQAD